MKKLLLATSLFIALPAVSAPYIGLEFGTAFVSGDIENEFDSSNVNLNPDSSDTSIAAFVGYQFNKNWGLELGYRQFELEDSFSRETFASDTVYLEEEWEESIEAQQLSLMPIYSYHLNEKWKLKGGVGVAYTQYEQHAEYSTEKETIFDEDIPGSETSLSSKRDQQQWGGIAMVGVEYNILSNLSVGAAAKYHADSYAESLSLNISTAYSF